MAMLSSDQEKAMELLLEPGVNVFITGKAGTGKSYLIHEYLNKISKESTLLTAPTGIAAMKINGVTLHSLFRIPVRPLGPNEFSENQKLAMTLRAAKVLFIDEVSMVRVDVFQYVCNTIQKISPNIKIVTVGDFLQLEPVLRKEEKKALEDLWKGDFHSSFAFDAPKWKAMNFQTFELTTIHRQNEDEKDFIKALHDIRIGQNVDAALQYINKNAGKISKQEIQSSMTALCPRNREADDINLSQLNQIDSPARFYNAMQEGKTEKVPPVPEELILKVGARVMTVVNHSEGLYRNGSVGVVKELCDDYVVVEFEDGGPGAVNVYPYQWSSHEYDVITVNGEKQLKIVEVGHYKQLPLRLAWGITIHKSQGASLSSAVVFPNFFADGQLYVALSRLSSIRGLQIIKEFQEYDCLTSRRAKEFYERGGTEKKDISPKKVISLHLTDEQVDFLHEKSAVYKFSSDLTENEILACTMNNILNELREIKDDIEQDISIENFTLKEGSEQNFECEFNSGRAGGFLRGVN